MGHVIQLRREGVEASAPLFIPFLGAVVGAKSLGGNALAEARVGLAGPDPRAARRRRAASRRRGDRQRLLVRAGLHRLLPEPLQPAAGRAARRRPRDRGDGAVDVVRRPRSRSSSLVLRLPQPDHAADRAVRGPGDLAALARAPQGGRDDARLLPRAPARTASPSAPSTSALIVAARAWGWTSRSSSARSTTPERPRRSAVHLAQRALHVALRLARADRLALVEAVLAARQRDLDLRVAAPRSRSASAPA